MLLPKRLASIDVFRAITMFLMIFVNDLWSLKGVPQWMEHTQASEDGMGLSDTIFPAFLFIVGLSLPFAISGRQSKGESTKDTFLHILARSSALLLIGFFHVNLESYSSLSLLPKPIWQILITIGFFLVWLDYSPTIEKNKRRIFQGAGIAILVLMAILYRGGDAENTEWMKPHWWGILGIIGWAYLLCASIYLFTKGKLSALIVALVFLLLYNIASLADYTSFLGNARQYLWIISNGSSASLVMAGIVTSVIYRRLNEQGKNNQFWLVLSVMAIVMFIAGFALRPNWGISKIRATPSWTMICTGISIICFIILIYLVDIKKKQDWFSWIKPAGTSTLTCYLLPYIHYALLTLVGLKLPLIFRTGVVGIGKSLIYSLIIILITGFLEKKRLRLKI